MITVRFINIEYGEKGLALFKSENIGFKVEGHSTKGRGNDIYCAGVSAIVQSCIAALIKLGATNKTFEQGDGFVEFTVVIAYNSPILREAEAIVGVLITGMHLMKSLPGSSIEILFDEV